MHQEAALNVCNQVCGTAEMLKGKTDGRPKLKCDVSAAWKAAFPCDARVRLDPVVPLAEATRAPAATCVSCGNMFNLALRIAEVVPGANYTGSTLDQVSKKAKQLNLKCTCGGAFSAPVLAVQEVACAFHGTTFGSQSTDQGHVDDPTLYKVAPSAAKNTDYGQMAINPFGEDAKVDDVQQPAVTAAHFEAPLTLLCSTFRHKLVNAVRAQGHTHVSHTGTVYKSHVTGAAHPIATEWCVGWTATKHVPFRDQFVADLTGQLVYLTREAQYVGSKPVVFGRTPPRKGTDEVERLVGKFSKWNFLLGILCDACRFLNHVVPNAKIVLRECLECELCQVAIGERERLSVWRFETHVDKKVVSLLEVTCRDQPFGADGLAPIVVVSCEVETLEALQ